MDYNTISINPYTKNNLELQRDITLTELVHSPYFFVKSICLVYINKLAKFDAIPVMTIQDIKKQKR